MIRRLILLTFLCPAMPMASSGQSDCNAKRIGSFSGEPLLMQWDGFSEALLLTFRTDEGFRHIQIDLKDNSTKALAFPAIPVYLAPHPKARAWAGALTDARPWTNGDYKFLSRFVNRKIFLRQPIFNPSGNLLAFSAYTPYKTEWRLMTYDLKYDNLNMMEGLPVGVSFPVWSPRGTFVSMIVPSDHPARQQVAIARWDATGLHYISSDSLSFEYASWPGSEQYLLITARGREAWVLIKQHISRPEANLVYRCQDELRYAIQIPATAKLAFLKRNGFAWELCLFDTAQALPDGASD